MNLTKEQALIRLIQIEQQIRQYGSSNAALLRAANNLRKAIGKLENNSNDQLAEGKD